MKIIFLDFTGTIDFYAAPKEKPVKKESGKINNSFNIKPYRSKVLGPSKRMKEACENFYENEENIFSKDFGYIGEGNVPFYSHEGFDEEGYVSTSYVYTKAECGPNKEAIKFLKKLVDKTEAKIVYSCTRRWDGWKACSNFVGLPVHHSLGHSYPKFGVTPELEYQPFNFKSLKDFDLMGNIASIGYKQREKEIQQWLNSWKGEKIDSFAILDDDPMESSEMLSHWIPSIQQKGSSTSVIPKCLRRLALLKINL